MKKIEMMRQIQPNKAALIPRYDVASAFGFGGLFVCIPLGLALWFFCNMAGWGDGATGNAINNPTFTAILLILPLVLYFGFGVVAALSTRRRVRKTLAVIANVILAIISLILGFVILATFPFAILGLIAVVVIFSRCWRRLTPKDQEAEPGGDSSAEPAV